MAFASDTLKEKELGLGTIAEEQEDLEGTHATLSVSEVQEKAAKADGNFQSLPTNAFGQILFDTESGSGSFHQPQYLRMTPTIDLDILAEYFAMSCEINRDFIVIVYGDKQGQLEDWKMSLEQIESLCKLISCTKAMMITHGIDSGPAKFIANHFQRMVSQGIGDHSEDFVICGVVPWNCVKGRELLINAPPTKWNKARY